MEGKGARDICGQMFSGTPGHIIGYKNIFHGNFLMQGLTILTFPLLEKT